MRVPVHLEARTGGYPEFRITEEKISKEELLRRIDAEPQGFSANVLLRPIKQDYLLPTLAYTGGAAEIAYFAQAAVVYEMLADEITPIVPRFSASLIEHKGQQLLERYRLSLPEVFCGPDQLREKLAAHSLSQELRHSFDLAEANVEKSLADIRDKLASLDKTLMDSATHAAEKMKYQLTQLRARASRAELRHTEILGRHADFLSNTLYPNKTLQEREVAGVYFLAAAWTRIVAGALRYHLYRLPGAPGDHFWTEKGEGISSMFTPQPIGFVSSPYKNMGEIPKGLGAKHEAEGLLKVLPEFELGLTDIEGFSHLFVIWEFDRSSGFELLGAPPSDDRPHGVFATRSPRRPNPLGLTVVELLRREGSTLYVRGVDMLDGTPILDIKPYLSGVPAERIRRGWLAEAEDTPKGIAVCARTVACSRFA